MKRLSANEIRRIWLDFFKSKGHTVIPSAPLIPQNDPSLLWINAGIAPLKKYFDGREVPINRRLVNSQKSIRTNDIENVGRTARHHTFFEMLGNFSIGDYFRNEALEWAIEILTSPQYFGFELDKLYFTIYPNDEETFKKWVSLGVKPDHIVRTESNFWEIGEGPCGPNTEIFYDRGEKYDPNNLGIKMLEEDLPNDRYIEIWNIVFSQYNAIAGLKREEYPELPSKNIDTGMGLERMACVMQEVETNFDTDLFMPIIQKTSELTNVKYTGQMPFKVIADHIRCIVFAISDGAGFSNEGRGYVLRRLIRRAIRYGRKLNMNEPFMYKLVDVVVDIMKEPYPELEKNKTEVARLIYNEEAKFLQTLENGEKKLLDYLKQAKNNIVDGEMAFLLYDTFGFPLELTIEVASEHGFHVDEIGFYEQLRRQKELSRSARSDVNSLMTQNKDMLEFKTPSKFVGYEILETKSKIIGIFKDGKLVNQASGEMFVVFDQTPFYGESGGQVGDLGVVSKDFMSFEVLNTIKLPNEQNASLIDTKDVILNINDEVMLNVDVDYRENIKKNHSATHLLNAALKQVLGSHISQQGSFLNDKILRFDFNHFSFPTNDQILEVEELVNQEIKKAHPVNISYMELEKAKAMNVEAVFGEKYGEIVRVVDMKYSKELCGGTHVSNTGEIEKFAIISIESKSSGIYRIVASTGKNISTQMALTLQSINDEINQLRNKAKEILKEAQDLGIALSYSEPTLHTIIDSYQSIIKRRDELNELREQVKELDKAYNKAKRDLTVIPLDEFECLVETVKETTVLVTKVFDLETEIVKDLADRIADGLASVVLLANVLSDKVIFVCKSKHEKVHAGQIVKQVAMMTGGNGGGRADFAQAGGKEVSKVDEVLEFAKETIKGLL